MTHDRPESLIAQLSQDAKALEARMLPEHHPLTQEQIDHARAEFKSFMDNEGLDVPAVAKAIDGAVKVISIDKFLQGAHVGDRSIRMLVRWMQQRRGAIMEGAPAELVSTRVADEIIGVYYNTLKSRSISIVTGPSGCGKTTVAKATAYELIPGALHLELPSVVTTGHQLLRFMAERLHLKGRSNPHSALNAIIDHFEGTNRLIVFDECHFLNQSALLVLRDIHKAAGCPMVLQGTTTLVDTINDLVAFIGQFRRLISYVYEIDQEMTEDGGIGPLFTPDDVLAYVKGMRLRLTAGGLRLATELVNIKDWGGLGKLTMLLLNCSRVKPEERIDDGVMRSILREMEGVRNSHRVSLHLTRNRERKAAVA